MDFSQYGGASAEWLEVEKTLPGRTFDLSKPVLELQQSVNKMREDLKDEEMTPYVSQLTITTYSIPTRDGSSIGARSYRPVSKPATEKLPVYMFFHGGGFLFGSLDTDDAACARTALNTGIILLHVNYRHTPHHTFPTAWHDTQDAFAWLHANIETVGADPANVVVGGISAGGTLAASLALEKHLNKNDVLKGLPDIAGQVLIIPCLNTVEGHFEGIGKQLKSPDISSFIENEDAPILPRRTIDYFYDLLKLGEGIDLRDTRVNMANIEPEKAKGLPPTVFGVAGMDPLRDDALLYAKMLAEVNVPTNFTLFKGVPHGFRRFGGEALKAAEHYDRVIAEGILWTLGRPGATGELEVKVV